MDGMSKLVLRSSVKMPFGRRTATHSSDINAFYDTISKVHTALESYEPLGKPDEFSHQSASVGLTDLTLASSACSPVSYSVTDDERHYFILPFDGEANCTMNRKTYTSSLSQGAMIIPGERRTGTTSELSMLQATLKSSRLISTAKTMLGNGFDAKAKDRFKNPHQLPIQKTGLKFDQMFLNICSVIDDCNMQTDLLTTLGFEDLFYRSLVTMVLPEHFVKDCATQRSAHVTPIDRVCDYIDAHLTEPIYLTDLEQFSNMSTRSLQYAFLKQLGCTPIEWIRMRRLALARQRLMNANTSETVMGIALDCGFSNASDFSKHFFRQYGELPSVTLKRSYA